MGICVIIKTNKLKIKTGGRKMSRVYNFSAGPAVLPEEVLKEASDSNVDLCAVGFLYRYGYFTQTLSMDTSRWRARLAPK